MEVIVTGKNVEVTRVIREYVERKMSTLGRHFNSLPVLALKVILSEEKTKSADKRFVAEFTTNVGDSVLRSEERGPDLRVAVDKSAEVLDRQIERWRGRRDAKRRLPVSANADVAGGGAPAEMSTLEEPYGSRISRVKRHVIKPMSPEEAIDQMELLGHDFFLFLNRENECLNVAYRRKAGDYGIIEAVPE